MLHHHMAESSTEVARGQEEEEIEEGDEEWEEERGTRRGGTGIARGRPRGRGSLLF